MRTRRVLLAASTGLLAAGCSSSSSSAPVPTPTPSSDVSSPAPEPAGSPSDVFPTVGSASTTPSSSPTPGAASTAPAVARCHTSQLRVSLGDSEGAAGTIFTTALLLNTSSAPCRIYGYPGLGLRSAAGADLPSHVVRGGGMLPAGGPGTVTLAPAVSASFSFTYSDNPTGSDTQAACRQAATLVVTPPDERDPLTVAFAGAPCEGTVHVSPVVAGTKGVQP